MLINRFIENAAKLPKQESLSVTVPRTTLDRMAALVKIIKGRGRQTNRSKVVQAMLDEYIADTLRPGAIFILKVDYYTGTEKLHRATLTISGTTTAALDALILKLKPKYPTASRSNIISAIAHYKLDELRI